MKQALAAKFEEVEAQVQANDQHDDERLGDNSAHTLPQDLADEKQRARRVEAALAELERLESEGAETPKRIPLTDPDSRIMPNKDGGHAPNYTPTATVDVDSGIAVAGDVLNNVNEDDTLISSIEAVQEHFGLESPPAEVLADGLMATGENLAACEEREIDLYAPIKYQTAEDNPAVREDLTQAVAEADYDRLPTKCVKRKGEQYEQLDKQAFVYDEAANCYWCPSGKRLSFRNKTREKTKRGATRERRRYFASPEDCAACPLKSRCLAGTAKKRMINREQHESLRAGHATKMQTEAAQTKYSRRSHAAERPFATIKQMFGARQFLLRGLSQVKQEWTWMLSAFNLHRLIGLIAGGAGPPPS